MRIYWQLMAAGEGGVIFLLIMSHLCSLKHSSLNSRIIKKKDVEVEETGREKGLKEVGDDKRRCRYDQTYYIIYKTV